MCECFNQIRAQHLAEIIHTQRLTEKGSGGGFWNTESSGGQVATPRTRAVVVVPQAKHSRRRADNILPKYNLVLGSVHNHLPARKGFSAGVFKDTD